MKEGIPYNKQRLSFEYLILEDDKTISQYDKIKNNVILHLIKNWYAISNKIDGNGPMAIFIQTLLGKTFELHTESTNTILEIKLLIQDIWKVYQLNDKN